MKILSRIDELKPEDLNARNIFYEILRETAEGIHTYSPCECGRRDKRSRMCHMCWTEVLGAYAQSLEKNSDE